MEILSKALPIDVISKIRLYHSHPLADLFKREFWGNLMYCNNWEVSFYDVWGGHKYNN